MKTIHLLVPRVLGGAVRYPVEGPLTVSDQEADAAIADKAAEAAFVEDGDLKSMKVDELKQLAASEEIDLGEATKKAEIIAAIEKAREAPSE